MTPIVVTRPSPDGERTCASLERAGIRAIHAPVMKFVVRPNVAPPTAPYSALAFTSANGIRAYRAMPWARPLPCYCVGEASAQAARDEGFDVTAIGGADVQSLAKAIRDTHRSGNILHVRGAAAAGDLVSALQDCHIKVVPSVLYEMQTMATLPEQAMGILQKGPAAVAFFSARTVTHFGQLAAAIDAKIDYGRHTAICLSDAVATAAASLRFGKITVCAQPNERSFVDTVALHLT